MKIKIMRFINTAKGRPRSKEVSLLLEEINYLKVNGATTCIILQDNKEIITLESIDSIWSRIEKKKRISFRRGQSILIHASNIARQRKVRNINQMRITFRDKTQITVF
jgi:hypothetical protein